MPPGLLRSSLFLLVSILRPLFLRVSECGFHCDSDDPGSLNDASLTPPPCFSKVELDHASSFYVRPSLLSLFLSSLDISFPFRHRHSVSLDSLRSSSTTVCRMRVVEAFMNSAVPRGLLQESSSPSDPGHRLANSRWRGDSRDCPYHHHHYPGTSITVATVDVVCDDCQGHHWLFPLVAPSLVHHDGKKGDLISRIKAFQAASRAAATSDGVWISFGASRFLFPVGLFRRKVSTAHIPLRFSTTLPW